MCARSEYAKMETFARDPCNISVKPISTNELPALQRPMSFPSILKPLACGFRARSLACERSPAKFALVSSHVYYHFRRANLVRSQAMLLACLDHFPRSHIGRVGSSAKLLNEHFLESVTVWFTTACCRGVSLRSLLRFLRYAIYWRQLFYWVMMQFRKPWTSAVL